MGQLEDMSLLVRIVEAGGIGKASEQLNIAKSAVSKRLKELEQRLGTQLLNRTTRKIHLTEAGEFYYQRALTIVDEVSELNTQTSGLKVSLSGTLKVTMPLSFGLGHLTSVIDDFTELHPQVKIHIEFSDRHVDLIEEGYELGIRIGELADSSLQAKRLTQIKGGLFASPEYLARRGAPIDHHELRELDYLQYSNLSYDKIPMCDPLGQWHHVQMQASMRANNGDFLREMAIQGKGIVFSPYFITYKAVQSGQLVPVLADYTFPEVYAYAVYPQTRYLSSRCRALIDFMAERFKGTPYWDSESRRNIE